MQEDANMTFRQFIKQVRLVNKPSSRTTKIVVGATVAFCVVCLLILHAVKLDAEAKKAAWQQEALKQEQEQEQLKDRLENVGSADNVEDIAKDELGLVDPDTIVITPEN